MKLQTFVFFSIFFLFVSSKEEKKFQYFRFKSISCNSSNKTLSSYSCSIKPLDRNTTSMSLAMIFKKPSRDIKVREIFLECSENTLSIVP